MTKHSDIFTPQGYLEGLQDRLQQIPSKKKPGRVVRVMPYLAFAASLVAVALVGNFILQKTAVPMDDYAFTREDIVNYLVDDGLTLEELLNYEEIY
ncbi:MAG: hypothetical protein J5835_07345 [Bacteroidales bacterium]|nr:hypothetical protein [Bacteroidales bacterium]